MNPMQSAPKDRPILLDVGCPWLVYGHWCECSGKWVYANLCQETHSEGAIEVWFENEHEKNPKGWLLIPGKIK
ncbi:MAG: hypothetical protein EBR90_03410 [Actinobacteria bacterium]|nr:hypothetical protein [Actinomycetota bacterium]